MRDSSYLELHHRVLAEFVSTGGSDLVQADELGLVADAIALKTPDESRLAAILPCGHTQAQAHTQSYSTYSSEGPPSNSDQRYYLRIIDHMDQKQTSTVILQKKKKQPIVQVRTVRALNCGIT